MLDNVHYRNMSLEDLTAHIQQLRDRLREAESFAAFLSTANPTLVKIAHGHFIHPTMGQWPWSREKFDIKVDERSLVVMLSASYINSVSGERHVYTVHVLVVSGRLMASDNIFSSQVTDIGDTKDYDECVRNLLTHLDSRAPKYDGVY